MSLEKIDIQRNSELLDFVAHHSQDAIFLAAPDGTLFFSNPAATRIFGYTKDEFLAGGIGLIWGKESLEACISKRGNDFYSMVEHSEQVHDNTGHAFQVGVSCASFQIGTAERVALVVRDRRGIQKAAFDHWMSEALAEQAPLMIYVTDKDWRILWANSAKAIGSGYSIKELMGQQSPLRRYLGEKKPQLLENVEWSLERTGKWEGDLYSRRRNGEVYPIRASISVVDDLQPGERNNIVMLTDVSTIRETERMLRQVSLYDPTTSLPNRTLLEQEVNKVLGHSNPETSGLHLLLMDIDSFGLVNEALGYETADRVLKHLAQELQNAVGNDKLLSRHTSDMFALLASDAASPTDVAGLVAQILETLRKPIEVEGHRFNLSLSIGVSKYPEDGETCDELLRTANVALQQVKQRGGNNYTFYHHGEEAISQRFVKLAGPLHDALEKNEFKAVFQPIVDSKTWEVVSMEALARWIRPDGTVIGPNEFIPVAESSGAIRGIFKTVLRQSCRQLRKLDQAGHPGLHASVNLSPRQFMDPDLGESILAIIAEEQLTPDRIYIEITENQLMDEPEQKGKVLGPLQDQGIKIIIDDFGTGYSSFGYLKHFDVDGIKLDRIFVKDIPNDKKGGKIASMIIGMGRELDIPVVAEGVETDAQAEFLRNLHCSRLQGFLIARPMAAEEFDVFLNRGNA